MCIFKAMLSYFGLHTSILNKILCYLLQKKVIEIRAQLLRVMKRFGLPLKSCDRDMQVRSFQFLFSQTHITMSFCVRRSTPRRHKNLQGDEKQKINRTTETKA
jgi:hypothetical protein